MRTGAVYIGVGIYPFFVLGSEFYPQAQGYVILALMLVYMAIVFLLGAMTEYFVLHGK